MLLCCGHDRLKEKVDKSSPNSLDPLAAGIEGSGKLMWRLFRWSLRWAHMDQGSCISSALSLVRPYCTPPAKAPVMFNSNSTPSLLISNPYPSRHRHSLAPAAPNHHHRLHFHSPPNLDSTSACFCPSDCSHRARPLSKKCSATGELPLSFCLRRRPAAAAFSLVYCSYSSPSTPLCLR